MILLLQVLELEEDGGGYYGGGAGGATQNGGTGNGAGGGSSFISGHNGCDAIAETSVEGAIVHTGQANHYSGLQFTNTIMIDGAGYSWKTVAGEKISMPKPTEGTYEMGRGHEGDGAVIVTLIST